MEFDGFRLCQKRNKEKVMKKRFPKLGLKRSFCYFDDANHFFDVEVYYKLY